MFEIISVVVPDPYILFWLAASIDDVAGVKTNGIKTLLANVVNTLFIDIKPAVVNSLRKSINLPSWLILFPVIPFNKIPPFSKNLITFITSFISLLVSLIPGPLPVIYFY